MFNRFKKRRKNPDLLTEKHRLLTGDTDNRPTFNFVVRPEDLDELKDKIYPLTLSELISENPAAAAKQISLLGLTKRIKEGLKVPGVSVIEDGEQATVGMAHDKLIEFGALPNFEEDKVRVNVLPSVNSDPYISFVTNPNIDTKPKTDK